MSSATERVRKLFFDSDGVIRMDVMVDEDVRAVFRELDTAQAEISRLTALVKAYKELNEAGIQVSRANALGRGIGQTWHTRTNYEEARERLVAARVEVARLEGKT